MVVQSLFKNLPMDLKLSSLFNMVSMVIREVRVKCFCLFIRTSFPPGRSSHVYRKILAESLERLNSTEGWNLNLQVSKSKKLKKYKFPLAK